MHSPTEPTLVGRRGPDPQGSGAWMAHTREHGLWLGEGSPSLPVRECVSVHILD